MMVTSKITSKGQITLPKEVRKLLNVQEGNVIVFENENDKIVIKPARTCSSIASIAHYVFFSFVFFFSFSSFRSFGGTIVPDNPYS